MFGRSGWYNRTGGTSRVAHAVNLSLTLAKTGLPSLTQADKIRIISQLVLGMRNRVSKVRPEAGTPEQRGILYDLVSCRQ